MNRILHAAKDKQSKWLLYNRKNKTHIIVCSFSSTFVHYSGVTEAVGTTSRELFFNPYNYSVNLPYQARCASQNCSLMYSTKPYDALRGM